MAEELLFVLAAEILMKLGSAAVQEIGVAWGAKDELQKLRRTVSTISAVLLDAEERGATNRQVADWLEKLWDAFYDADDLFDEFSTEYLRRQVMTQDKMAKKVSIFFSRTNQIAFRLKMGHRVKAIRQTLDAIADDGNKFQFAERVVHIRFVDSSRRDETHSFVRTNEVFGRDEDKREIVKRLLDPNVSENVEVISVVGIGGLGKTTLAQLVYNDDEVTKYFELKLWVCVSDVFDVKSIAKKIIESATGRNESKESQMDKVQQKLRNEINGKKYFLVLDDVWNEDVEKWLRLRDLLMGGARGSKVLITTRMELVAKISGSISPHVLEGLSENESWSLFKKMAFKGNEESENPQLVKIGKEIVEKCKGVPLAIRAIGSLLSYKDTVAEWQYIKENNMLKIAQEQDIIMPILKLSYSHLPSHLKKCFAFCSLYPKDCEIDREDLIQLWIACGLIQVADENSSLEDMGGFYFMDLARRSFFHDVETYATGRTVCKMHDLVHDLAQLVSRPRSMVLYLKTDNNVSERTRHVSFGYRMDPSWKIPSSLLSAKKLRTFLLQKNNVWEKNEMNKLALENIISSFEKLRVLDLHNNRMEKVPSCLGGLKQLRYLDLSWNRNIKVLPSSITKLQNLQTLKLNGCSNLEELPKDFRKMISLRHLELEQCRKLRGMPSGIGQLSKLCRIKFFVVGSCKCLSELKGLNNLRGDLRLQFRGAKHLKSAAGEAEEKEEVKKAKYLSGKQYIESLKLDFHWKDWDERVMEGLRPHQNLKELTIRYYKGGGLPRWMVDDIHLSLPNLVSIELNRIEGCKDLPQLGLLPCLRRLELHRLDGVEFIDSTNGDQPAVFPSLAALNLSSMPNLEGWWRSSRGTKTDPPLQLFPRLSHLSVVYCPRLASLPHLPTCLEDLRLCNVSEKLVQQVLSRRTSALSLSISEVKNLVALPEVPSQSLTSLSRLLISQCKRLTSLSRWMPHLTALEELEVIDCEELCLSDDDDGLQFQSFASLTILQIERLPKLVSLPGGLQRLTALSSLSISRCQNLRTLPRWMSNLTSLQTLSIRFCPTLSERCQKETGED